MGNGCLVEVPRFGAWVPVCEVLQALGSVGQVGVELESQMVDGGYRVRAVGGGKGEGPEGLSYASCLGRDGLQVAPEVVVEKHLVA